VKFYYKSVWILLLKSMWNARELNVLKSCHQFTHLFTHVSPYNFSDTCGIWVWNACEKCERHLKQMWKTYIFHTFFCHDDFSHRTGQNKYITTRIYNPQRCLSSRHKFPKYEAGCLSPASWSIGRVTQLVEHKYALRKYEMTKKKQGRV